MGRILNTLERISNQSGLSAGISDVSDVELLVSSLPSTTKETLKKDLGLDNGTTDSQLVSLIASDEFDGGEPFTPVIEPIDIEGMQPFEPIEREGEGEGEGSITDFLDNPNLQDGEGEGEGQGEGEGEGQGEGEGEGEDDGEGQGEGEGEGEGQGEGEGESQQEKVENELLEFGYQPLFMDLNKVLNKGFKEDVNGKTKYLLIEELKYVTVHYVCSMAQDEITYKISVFSSENIKPQDFTYQVKAKFKFVNETEFSVIVRFFATEKSDELIIKSEDTRFDEYLNKTNAFDTFNLEYQKATKELNKALISEAEICSQFIENIK